MKLYQALKEGVVNLFKYPRKSIFSLPLLLVYGVYSSTYITANCIDVYNERSKASGNKADMTKLFGTTAVNMSASLVRDGSFAKLFGK